MDLPLFDPSKLGPEEAARRRHRMLTLLLVLTGPGVLIMADLHWRTGFDGWKVLHLAVFTVLFLLVALGAAQSLVGFALRRKGGDPCRIGGSLPPDDGAPIPAPTAVVMPICNEEVGRVMAGIRSTYESIQRSGRLPECHFFILSDSTNPNNWIAEEAAWLALTRELNGHGRIFYRRRKVGINKKAGNLADFCRRWGRLYRYMVVLDADSIMTGSAIVRLVRLMERNRRVGIIQGVPLLANGETVLARLQQFASRLYGPVSAAGLNYWQLGEANYWGHNAVIRLAPFMQHCSLPELPPAGPFGGRILSHDYVEAALMRRAGWQVWLATELDGNYEECPATIVDLAKRDRRWLQGNLQHARLVVAKGFHGVNRVHFLLGILSYLASPLWLGFLVLSTVIAARLGVAGEAAVPQTGFAAYLHWSYAGEALSLFGYTLGLLFLAKALALADLRPRPAVVATYGGWGRLAEGVVLETLIFTLLAPILMLFHTWFILLTLVGKKVSWGTQNRGGAADSAWAEPFQAHAGQTVIGLVGAALVYRIDPRLAAWMSPILAGLIFSIPLSYFTGTLPLGLALRRRGIFQTPEESAPLPELRRFADAVARRHDDPRAARRPGRQLRPPAGGRRPLRERRPRLAAPGQGGDPLGHRGALRRAPGHAAPGGPPGPRAPGPHGAPHGPGLDARPAPAAVATPAAQLAQWWQLALMHYGRLAPAVATPFNA